MGSLLDKAKTDVSRFNSDAVSGFAQDIIFTPQVGDPVTVTGQSAKLYLPVASDGNMVSERKAHVSVSEQVLIDAGYIVRNGDGEIDLKNHTIQVKDNTGTLKKYAIDFWEPDEQLGLIIIFLEDSE